MAAFAQQALVNKSDPMKSSIPGTADPTQSGTSNSERVHYEKRQIGLPVLTIPGAASQSRSNNRGTLKHSAPFPEPAPFQGLASYSFVGGK